MNLAMVRVVLILGPSFRSAMFSLYAIAPII